MRCTHRAAVVGRVSKETVNNIRSPYLEEGEGKRHTAGSLDAVRDLADKRVVAASAGEVGDCGGGGLGCRGGVVLRGGWRDGGWRRGSLALPGVQVARCQTCRAGRL